MLVLYRWVAARNATHGITSLTVRAVFSEGTATQALDTNDRQVAHVLDYLLPTLAALLGEHELQVKVHIKGQCQSSDVDLIFGGTYIL